MKTETLIQQKSETDFVEAFSLLEQKMLSVLHTYSNVERGSGQFSQITTTLYHQARKVILDYLHLSDKEYTAIFCSPMWAEHLKRTLLSKNIFVLSSHDIGLPIGLRILVVRKKDLPKNMPAQMGGGTIKLVSSNSLVLADIPERFETGTPSVVNAIVFAVALTIIGKSRFNPFQLNDDQKESTHFDQILNFDKYIDLSGKELLNALQQTMIGKNVRIPVEEGEKQFINFDNAASTPSFLPVMETVCQTWIQPAYRQKNIVSEVKNISAKFFNAPLQTYDVIFCTNTTEAINIASRNFIKNPNKEIQPVVLNTFLEHHSNELPWRFSSNAKLIRLNVNNEGIININELEKILCEYNELHKHGMQRINLVAVSGASNVLGTFNDIRSISRIAHKYNAQILVDGAQLVAHRKVDMLADDIDFLAFSGHKMYAPFGSGALITKKELMNFKPEELNEIKTSGEENVVGIAAMGKSMVLLQRIGMDAIQIEEQNHTRYTLNKLLKIKGITIYGIHDTSSNQIKNKGAIISFKIHGVPHNLVAKELAEIAGIGVRSGCFCAHLMVKQLMGITPFRGKLAEVLLKYIPSIDTSTLPGIVRISFGLENDDQEIDQFINAIKIIAKQPRSAYTKFVAFMNNGQLALPQTKTGGVINSFIENKKQSIFR